MIIQKNLLKLFKHNRIIEKTYPRIKIDLNKYLIDDILGEKLKYLFVLESPHKKEILSQNKCPAAGKTGINLTEMIFNNIDTEEKIPLGKLLKEYRYNINYKFKFEGIEKLGIMNVSQIPLQGSAYSNNLRKEYKELFKSLNIIRKDPFAKNRDSNFTKELEKEIMRSFVFRIHNILDNNNLIIIPCGHVAKYFYKEYLFLKDKNSIDDISHPSNWTGNIENIRSKIFDWSNINFY